MTATSGEWLFVELERAAEQYKEMPEWARPVVTVPYSNIQPSERRPIGSRVEEPVENP